jgi:hypothetical protein
MKFSVLTFSQIYS